MSVLLSLTTKIVGTATVVCYDRALVGIAALHVLNITAVNISRLVTRAECTYNEIEWSDPLWMEGSLQLN